MSKNLTLFLSILIVFHGNIFPAFNPVIILAGPPGSGKGTFSHFFKESHGYNHINIGDILRLEIEMQTDLGREIKEIVKKGDYIDSKIILVLLEKNIKKYQAGGKPLILDGFGQNEGDIEAMKKLLHEIQLLSRTFFVYLDASDAICLERMTHRSVCLNCSLVYNSETAKPTLPNVCDRCGMALRAKINDDPDIIKKRLHHYRDYVEPLYNVAFRLFPSIIYCSNGSVEECNLFCSDLALKAKSFDGDANSFVKEFRDYANTKF